MQLREYSNKHLQEVLCGFNFVNSGVVWDSAYFGQYLDKISAAGFTAREERKGVQINFGDVQSDIVQSIKTSAREIESTMLFKNEAAGRAITMGKDQISFHVVSDYPGWETFLKELIEPGMSYYQELGLLSGAIRSNVVYLNRFEFDADESISDYFTFLNPVGTDFGSENNSITQRVLDYNERLMLIVRLHTAKASGDKIQAVLECGATTKQFEKQEPIGWQESTKITHEPIRGFFESLITDQLKNRL